MAGLAGLIRSAVATAATVTRDLQVDVEHYPAVLLEAPIEVASDGALAAGYAEAKRDGFGNVELGDVTRRKALYERATRVIRGLNGKEQTTHGKVTFLGNVAVHPDDRIVPPDGHRGPIVDIKSLADPAGGGYLIEVWLGTPTVNT
jgi:hypothetical protein